MRLIDGDDQSAYTSILSSTASERSVGEPLKLVWYQMTSTQLQNAESWVMGRPEIRLIVFYGATSSMSSPQVNSQLLSPTRNHIKDGCNPNATILPSWDPNSDGSVLTFVWIEEDPNGSYNISANLKYEDKSDNGSIFSCGANGSYSAEFEDYEIGRGFVYWWNPYSTNFMQGLTFRLGK